MHLLYEIVIAHYEIRMTLCLSYVWTIGLTYTIQIGDTVDSTINILFDLHKKGSRFS